MKQRILYMGLLGLLATSFGSLRVAPVAMLATSAYLTDQEEKDNPIRFGDLSVSIVEEFDPPKELTPGTSFSKIPCVVNTSQVPCFLRARVSFSSSEARNLCEPLVIGSHWLAGEDGMYYYDQQVAPQASTEPLFTYVKVKSEVSQEEVDQCLPFDIYVYAEGIGAGGPYASSVWEQVEEG